MGARNTKYWLETLKVFGWCVILAITLFWSSNSSSEGGINDFGLAMLIANFIPLILIYVLNNYLVIPRFLFKDRRAMFLIINICFIALLLIFSYYVGMREFMKMLDIVDVPTNRPRRSSNLSFLAQDLVNYILMIGFVTSLRLMGRLQQSEEALKEAENAKIKAELDNLRSQINPHFLLNTLNNIYALTAIDAEKAQKSIKELSLLLRYVLYDNLSDKVLLVKEVEFLKNYIELMRIRLSRKVQLNVEYNLKPESTTQIAPLIFISLIENAFKHGISAEVSSFIDIKIDNNIDAKEVTLSIRNSNNAKMDNDKSGCGIGLDQVKRRLELQYPDAHTWIINDSKEVYESILTLKSEVS